MKKRLHKKLTFNKTTIASLSAIEKKIIKGGVSGLETCVFPPCDSGRYCLTETCDSPCNYLDTEPDQ